MAGSPETPEQQIALQNFVNLTEVLSQRQKQVEELAAERRRLVKTLRGMDVSVAVIAKSAGLGQQAVYKLLSASE